MRCARALWGESDALIPLRADKKPAERIPDAELAVLPECRHLPMEGFLAVF